MNTYSIPHSSCTKLLCFCSPLGPRERPKSLALSPTLPETQGRFVLMLTPFLPGQEPQCPYEHLGESDSTLGRVSHNELVSQFYGEGSLDPWPYKTSSLWIPRIREVSYSPFSTNALLPIQPHFPQFQHPRTNR